MLKGGMKGPGQGRKRSRQSLIARSIANIPAKQNALFLILFFEIRCDEGSGIKPRHFPSGSNNSSNSFAGFSQYLCGLAVRAS